MGISWAYFGRILVISVSYLTLSPRRTNDRDEDEDEDEEEEEDEYEDED